MRCPAQPALPCLAAPFNPCFSGLFCVSDLVLHGPVVSPPTFHSPTQARKRVPSSQLDLDGIPLSPKPNAHLIPPGGGLQALEGSVARVGLQTLPLTHSALLSKPQRYMEWRSIEVALLIQPVVQKLFKNRPSDNQIKRKKPKPSNWLKKKQHILNHHPSTDRNLSINIDCLQSSWPPKHVPQRQRQWYGILDKEHNIIATHFTD